MAKILSECGLPDDSLLPPTERNMAIWHQTIVVVIESSSLHLTAVTKLKQ